MIRIIYLAALVLLTACSTNRFSRQRYTNFPHARYSAPGTDKEDPAEKVRTYRRPISENETSVHTVYSSLTALFVADTVFSEEELFVPQNVASKPVVPVLPVVYSHPEKPVRQPLRVVTRSDVDQNSPQKVHRAGAASLIFLGVGIFCLGISFCFLLAAFTQTTLEGLIMLASIAYVFELVALAFLALSVAFLIVCIVRRIRQKKVS